MKKLNLAAAAAIVLSVTSSLGYADARQLPHREFNKTVVREAPNGNMTRTIEQRQLENGYTRHQTLTAPDGRTANRNTTVTNDADNQTRTRTMSGTHLNGESYSGEKVTTRTENGYHSSATRTNATGQTASRIADVTVDKENGVVTKQISGSDFNGNAYAKTVVVEKPASGGE